MLANMSSERGGKALRFSPRRLENTVRFTHPSIGREFYRLDVDVDAARGVGSSFSVFFYLIRIWKRVYREKEDKRGRGWMRGYCLPQL